jgi:transglutaminase-like putative cysteine protease
LRRSSNNSSKIDGGSFLMLLEVEHITSFSYSSPVHDVVMELRLGPMERPGQVIKRFDLAVMPYAPTPSHWDAFGNRIHTYAYYGALAYVEVTSRTFAEIHERLVAEWIAPAEVLRYRQFGGPIANVPGVIALAAEIPTGADPGERLWRLTELINDRFDYEPMATQVNSTVDDFLRLGRGVCQDFTHLWVGVARALGYPARYVSGYIYNPAGTEKGADASHAWGEAYVENLGWIGFDPTNRKPVGDQHLAVAVGRDYRDIAPTKGVYRGLTTELLSITVNTREYTQLPAGSSR